MSCAFAVRGSNGRASSGAAMSGASTSNPGTMVVVPANHHRESGRATSGPMPTRSRPSATLDGPPPPVWLDPVSAVAFAGALVRRSAPPR